MFKYPRSYHLPNSLGITNDDKIIPSLSCFENKLVYFSEKMDGENTTMYKNYIHARSLDSKSHPSRDYVKMIWGNINYLIPEGWRICGENVYAKHSIYYENLESYFLVFSVWNENNMCLDLYNTYKFCSYLGLKMVPLLKEPHIFDLNILNDYCKNINTDTQEGLVVRNAGSFHFNEFDYNLAKWVRKNHVQTDKHWMNSKIIPNKLKQ